MNKKRLTVLFAALALTLAGCGAGDNYIRDTQTSSETREESERQSETEETERQTEVTEPSFPVGRKGDDYILPAAQTHVYTKEELAVLTAAELRLARNEIYARQGRKFKSEDLNRYFSGKSWYQGAVEADQFDDSVLNECERENLKLLQLLESETQICEIPKIGIEEFPVIDGSTATLPISQAMYRMSTGASVKEAEAAVSHNKTTRAWRALGWDRDNGVPDLVIAYEPGERVLEEIREAGGDILMKPIGRDALVFLKNQSNPVESLTTGQIVDIYSGVTGNWKEVGGKDKEILAFQRPEDSGSQNLMEKLVMKGKEMARAPKEHVVGEMGELIKRVSAYDGTGDALGYSVYYYAKNMFQKPELAFMAVDGVAPDSGSIRDGSYPFVNDFYAAVRADEPKDSKAYQLYEWLTSEDGQSLINGLGYVGVGEGAKELPGMLTEQEETFNASIPLPEGYVILASGQSLYGEYGIGVLDSRMRLIRFIPHVESGQVDNFLECSQDAAIYMTETLTTGKEGYYSIKENRWMDDKTEPVEESAYSLVYAFAGNHPELLEKYGVTESQVEPMYFSDSLPPVMRISAGNMEHYYDAFGNHLLDFDMKGLAEDQLPYRYVEQIDGHMAYLRTEDMDTRETIYKIYRDGVLVKEINENENEYIGDICPHFYTIYRGNYMYIYNYQDEACAKFLEGYYGDD